MEANNIRPMKKWSQRSRKRRDGKISTNLFELRKQIRNLLIIFLVMISKKCSKVIIFQFFVNN